MMQLRYLILPIILIVLSPISAMSDERHGSVIPFSQILDNDINLNRDIKKALISLEKEIEEKDHKGIINSVKELELIRLNLGTKELPFVAEYLRRKGNFLITTGTVEVGIKLMEEARSAFPRYYPLYFDLAKVYLSKEYLNFKKGIIDLIDGLRAYSRLKSRKGHLLSFILFIFIIVYTLSLSIYLPILLLKHFKRLHRDIKKILHLPEESLLSSLIALFTILFPLVTGGLFPFLISIPVFVWGYLKGIGERIVLIFSIVCLVSFYPVTQGTVWSLFETEDPFVREYERFSANIWDAKTFTIFKSQLQSQPNNYFLNAAVGLMYKRMNDKEIALKYFQDQLNRFPDNPYLLVNIGDIRLTLGENEEALRIYNKVIEIDPDNVEGHYNLSTALMNQFEMDKANEEYKKAYRLNPSGVDRYLELVKKGLEQPMDTIPDVNHYKVKGRYAVINLSNESLYNLLLFPFGLNGGYITIPFMLLILTGAWWLITKRGISDQCQSCGSLLEEGAKCTLCSALKLSPDRLDPKMRDKGIRKVNEYKKMAIISQLLFNLVLPGTGIVLEGYNIKGFVVTFLNISSIVCIISTIYFQLAPVLIGVFIVIYLLFNFMTNLILLKKMR